MNTHRIDSNELFATEITVRESDPYSDSILIRVLRTEAGDTDSVPCNEVFMSVDELEALGKFLVSQAAAIRRSSN